MPSSKTYFEFESAAGPVLIETSAEVEGMGPIAAEGVVRKTGDALEGVLARLDGVIGPLQRQIHDRLSDASEVSIEFGIKLAGKAGLIVAESEFESNFKVVVKWTRP